VESCIIGKTFVLTEIITSFPDTLQAAAKHKAGENYG